MSDDDDDYGGEDFLIKRGLQGIVILGPTNSFPIMRIITSAMAQTNSVIEAGRKSGFEELSPFIDFLSLVNQVFQSVGAGQGALAGTFAAEALEALPDGEDE